MSTDRPQGACGGRSVVRMIVGGQPRRPPQRRHRCRPRRHHWTGRPHFLSADGHGATKSFDWADLRLIDPEHTSDDAVRDIARWRARHQLGDHTPGIGARPVDPGDGAGWDELHVRLGLTRAWLASTDRIHPDDTVIASHRELLERRAELEEI